MTTPAKLAAAKAATAPLVDKMIQDAEAGISNPFIRRQADQAVEEHRAQIDAGLDKILDVGIDAAAKVDETV